MMMLSKKTSNDEKYTEGRQNSAGYIKKNYTIITKKRFAMKEMKQYKIRICDIAIIYMCVCVAINI
jgi:hypothetical protein